MGCGASKTSVTSPVTQLGDTLDEACQSPVPTKQVDGEDVKEVQKEPISLKSFSSKSLDSDVKSTSSSSEDESTEGPNSPVGIQAPGENRQQDNTRAQSSPSVVESKKGCVAFNVPLDDSETATLDNVLRKPLPKRLRHLEPLSHTPQITTEKLMEKLEKAEEKRRKALARYKEKSARRKEIALRRNEHMGDVIPNVQLADGLIDSDQSGGEKLDSKQVTENMGAHDNGCNENVNWNQSETPASPTTGVSSSNQESPQSVDQNNNNIRVDERFTSQQLIAVSTKSSQSRYGCFLQAVQEEEEVDTSTDDDDCSVSSRSKSSVESSRTEENWNPSNKRCGSSNSRKYRAKGT